RKRRRPGRGGAKSIWTFRHVPPPPTPWGLRTDVDVQTAGRQADNIQTERGGRAPVEPQRRAGRRVSSAPALPSSLADCETAETAGDCRFSPAAPICSPLPPGRAPDGDRGTALFPGAICISRLLSRVRLLSGVWIWVLSTLWIRILLALSKLGI